MNKIITLFILLQSASILAQPDINDDVFCDSIIMLDGSIKMAQIQEIKRNKIIYFLCCNECKVPRQINKKEIDTIISYRKETVPAEIESKEPKTLVNIDSTKYLELEKKGEVLKIIQGKKVFVKVGSHKYSGDLRIIDDFTLMVNESFINLSDVDMIAKPNTGKTIGLIFASLPIEFIGFVLIAGGISWGAEIIPAGVLTMGVGITGVIMEAKRGKRYHAYYRGQTDGTVNRKWTYTIKSL